MAENPQVPRRRFFLISSSRKGAGAMFTTSAKIVFFVFIIGVAASLGMITKVAKGQPASFTAGSVVKVKVGQGHGSATHIGNGHFITAAHVVPGDNLTITLLSDDGIEVDAEVVWIAKSSDIALLKAKEWSHIASSSLSCTTPKTGDLILARGNPVNLEHVVTRGYVAGIARQLGPWRSVIPVDMTVAGGMSGGGVFDQDGNLVGVTVGLMLMGLGFTPTAIGLSYVVPGKAVCDVMARA